MKKTLSALLLLGTVMASTASQVRAQASVFDAGSGRIVLDDDTVGSDSSDEAGFSIPAGKPHFAEIHLTAVRQQVCDLEITESDVNFDDTDYVSAKEVPLKINSNAPQVTISVSSTYGGLIRQEDVSVAESEKITYSIELNQRGPIFAADATEQAPYSFPLEDKSIWKNAKLKFKVSEGDYESASYGTYKDVVTVTVKNS